MKSLYQKTDNVAYFETSEMKFLTR